MDLLAIEIRRIARESPQRRLEGIGGRRVRPKEPERGEKQASHRDGNDAARLHSVSIATECNRLLGVAP